MRLAEKIRATIVAIATAPGEGGIGVVRLSGEKALEIADRLFQAKSGKKISSQKNFSARYGLITGSETIIDEALLLVMRAPKSYTGEDVAELSVHGGPAVLQAVVRRALEEGAQLAEPGEFTKRAFLNGRIDLLQAEAVLDLVRAKTERMRGWASGQLEGRLSLKMKSWKETLLALLSHLEAMVDFPEDLPETQSVPELARQLRDLSVEMTRLLEDSELAFVAKRGFQAVLCGMPNVGKSSLLNRMARTDRVIVTPHPGTTRDVVEAEISLRGWPLRLMDTAGIHDTEHPIEKEGIARSKRAVQGADLILMVLDATRPLESHETQMIREFGRKRGILILNKSDLAPKIHEQDVRELQNWPVVGASAVSDAGTEALELCIERLITDGHLETPGESLLSSARQKSLLEKVSKDIMRSSQSLSDGLSPEFAAADLRNALDGLGEIVGEVFNDEMLDILFNQFCIGK